MGFLKWLRKGSSKVATTQDSRITNAKSPFNRRPVAPPARGSELFEQYLIDPHPDMMAPSFGDRLTALCSAEERRAQAGVTASGFFMVPRQNAEAKMYEYNPPQSTTPSTRASVDFSVVSSRDIASEGPEAFDLYDSMLPEDYAMIWDSEDYPQGTDGVESDLTEAFIRSLVLISAVTSAFPTLGQRDLIREGPLDNGFQPRSMALPTEPAEKRRKEEASVDNWASDGFDMDAIPLDLGLQLPVSPRVSYPPSEVLSLEAGDDSPANFHVLSAVPSAGLEPVSSRAGSLSSASSDAESEAGSLFSA